MGELPEWEVVRSPTSPCTSLCRARTGGSPSPRPLGPLSLLSLTTLAPPMELDPTGRGLSVLPPSDTEDLLEELDMPDLLEELDMEELLEELDMEVSLEEGLLELLLHLWPVLMDSPTVEPNGAKAEDTTLVSYFTGHNNSQTWTHRTYKRQNSYNASVWKLIFIIFNENIHLLK